MMRNRTTLPSHRSLVALLAAVAALALGACSGEVNDGLPDLEGVTCSSCHGNEFNAAPPAGVNGEENDGTLAVGVHQAHMNDGTIRKSVGCGACHKVPLTITEAGHIDPLPAEVQWGILARLGAAEPAWDRDAGTCSSTYCHGATLAGGTETTPSWTNAREDALSCDSCHGNPPPAPHPQADACEGCHPETVTSSGLIDVEGGRHIDGVIQAASQGCNGCHGNEDNAAPPVGLNGATETDDLAVGAHQVHLRDGDIRAAIACSECHAVPRYVDEAGHLDAPPADLQWGDLARLGGIVPAWDRDTATCSSTYCHGATLSGGDATDPVWTVVDGSQSTCGSCHGNPPPAPHPQSDDCSLCHPGTLTEDGAIDVAGGQHIDGTVQLVAGDCSACHGNEDNAAPPVALDGATTTDDPGVGAHQAHLLGGTVRAALACSDCHPAYAALDDAGHLDGAPVEFSWSALASADGAAPAYDFDAGTCSSTYCHGATLSGGTHSEPAWTVVDGSQLSCASCHGFPPAAPHPANTDCGACHPGTTLPGGGIDLEGGQHIDGDIDLATSCVACHGGEDGPAPPVSLNGESDVTALGVGAHQAHLQGGALRDGIACGECHPATTSVADHIDDLIADLVWGELATTGDVAPVWDRDAATCSSTYCHGATLSGGDLTAPVWTDDSDAAIACGACHGNPPPAPHPQSDQCGACHPDTVGTDGALLVAGGAHINGVVDVPSSCTACHGGTAGPAPPPDLDGDTDTDALGVGAHQAHLQGGTVRAGIQCTECHTFPLSVDAEGHLDTPPADLVWGPLATTDEVTPAWDRDAATCSSTYCHGATLSGGSNTAPVWTDDSGAATGCASCHGFPPPAPHPNNTNCRQCHADTILESGGIDIEGGQHIDGEVDLPFDVTSCSGCHGSDANAAPPVDLDGGSDPTTLGVGAHQAHLQDGTFRAAIACDECHPVPAALDTPPHLDGGPADLVWGALATAGDLAPTWDRDAATCSSTWCHGGGIAGGIDTVPLWTAGDDAALGCASCHGFPPPAPHPDDTNCRQCHEDTLLADGGIDIDGGQHIDGEVDLSFDPTSCSGCHGSEANAAPPVDLDGGSDPTTLGVGAHQAHLVGGTFRSGIACDECHPVPAALTDAPHLDGGAADLAWGALATAGDLAPTWDRDAATCSSTWCHGGGIAGGTDPAPLWTAGDAATLDCSSCHGFPPPAPHPNNANCTGCHPGTVQADGSLDLAGGLHIDGQVQRQISPTGACDTCHGAPPDTGAHRVHYARAPGAASYGGTGIVTTGGPDGYGFDCGVCHPTDAAHHGDGVPNAGGGAAAIDLSAASAEPGTVKALNPPTATYTPGDTVLTDARGYEYTLGSCSDVYCHSRKEIAVPGPVPAPGIDFDFTGFPIEYPPYDVQTWRTYETVGWGDTDLGCDGCHMYPPRTFEADVAAGAGDSHSWVSADGLENLHAYGHAYAWEPTRCATCHHATVTEPGAAYRDPDVPEGVEGLTIYEPVPIAGHASHANGVADVAFPPTPVTMKPGADPHPLDGASWDPATRTCSGVSCHREQVQVQWGQPYRWRNNYECDQCHQFTN